MNAADATNLRQQIVELDAQGLAKQDIATRLGCARSTVYKVLADPGPDRRRSPSPRASAIPEATAAEVRRLREADPTLSPPAIHAILARQTAGADPIPVPSISTIARLLATRESAPPDAADGESSPGFEHEALLPAYERAGASRIHYMALQPEAALLRALVREAVAELDRPVQDPRLRPRQREHLAGLLLTFLRASHLVKDAEQRIPWAIRDPEAWARDQAEMRAVLASIPP